MKKNFLCFIAILLGIICTISLVGCMGSNDSTTIDYNADIQVVSPSDIDLENFIVEDGVTYYTSSGLSLWMEVNGAFVEMDYFSIDGDKRVYDNMYFYVDDYFYMLSGDLKGWYASLGDNADLAYAEVERQSGEDIQINIKKAGIYKLTFDVKTLKFDLEYKSEIQTPVYYPIKNCNIYSKATSWVAMSVNPTNADEFVINDYNIATGAYVSFYNNTHTSNYKVTLEESVINKIASQREAVVYVNVGGNYNVYVDRKTYKVRLELINPDSATYSCVYYDGTDFNTLSPYDASVPYVFRQRIVVTTKNTTSLPKFHTEKSQTYDLTVVDTANLLTYSGKYYYFKNIGTYDMIINLKTFELSVELLPE